MKDPVFEATKAQLEQAGLPTHGRTVPADPSDEVYQATLAEVTKKEDE